MSRTRKHNARARKKRGAVAKWRLTMYPSAFDHYFAELDACYRHGVVNAAGWDDQGRAIGGHLTQDAAAEIAGALWDLSEATGLDYGWLRMQGF